MPPEQTPTPTPQPPEKQPFNFLETDPKKNFAPWFLIFCTVLIIIGLAIAGYFKYQAYQNYKAGMVVMETTQELSIEQKLLRQGIILPPDPGEAGKLTLEGIDSDNDGVRDDVQRWIATNFGEEPQLRGALIQAAIATQHAMIAGSENDRREALAEELASARCLVHLRGATQADEFGYEIDELIANTPTRSSVYADYLKQLKASWFDTPPMSEFESFCHPSVLTADWQTYRNEEYGFEFKHPPTWVSNEKINNKDYFELVFAGSIGVMHSILALDISRNENIKDLRQWVLSQGERRVEFEIKEVSFNNQAFINWRIDWIGYYAEVYSTLTPNGNVLSIFLGTPKILSTFKFIE